MCKKETRIRKTLIVMKNANRYRLFAEDIKKIIRIKINKNNPNIPKY
jgi:hypothetical protein